jgi:acyl-ACP thioesterase
MDTPTMDNGGVRDASPARSSPPPPAFRPEPPGGRVFEGSRSVRGTDVTPAGRLRLDAVARYLQDVAEDDVAETGWQAPYGWLLRRCSLVIAGYPRFGDRVVLRTFCSATGPRWAERTTTLAGPDGERIQAVALWVAADRATGRPCPLGEEFARIYGPATQGRAVSSRLSLPGPESVLPGPAAGRDWPLRASDFDTAGHVNNSVHWAALEEVLAGTGWRPATAELEYHRPVLPTSRPRLLAAPADDGGLHTWLLDGTERLASGRLAR